MNADRLLTHYERIADAPDAIVRFRRFILDLAVRGNLVEQDPNDEPASKLLKRIASEKARLVKTGKIKKQKIIPTLLGQDMPCPLPVNWRWSQIAEIGVLSPRNDVDDDVQSSFVPMPLIASGYGLPIEHEVRQWGEIKKGYTHFAEGDVGLAKITPCFENGKSAVFRNLTGGLGSGTTELHIVRPLFVDPDYILIFLKCSHFIEAGISKMTGTAGQKRVPTEYFASSSFPLPPLAEQHRIVAKVDELMALCERLEAARAEREATRDRLATASLARLNAPAPDPTVFQGHAAFAFENLVPLTTRLDQIKALRQTILNLAVRGKLVEQDPNDEPASELLKRIAAEKARLVKSGKIREPKIVMPLEPEERLFPTPKGWSWVRLREIGITQTGTTPSSSKPELFGDFIPFVKPADLDGPSINYDGPGLSEEGMNHSRVAPAGTVMMVCIGATLGKVNVTDRPVCFNQQINSITPYLGSLFTFLSLALKSSNFQAQAWSKAGVGTLPIVSKGKWEVLPIPLPPLSEQRQIIAKVDELMALCDRLEASVGAAGTARHCLLESLLQDALEPAANELEVAE